MEERENNRLTDVYVILFIHEISINPTLACREVKCIYLRKAK